jgi:arabinan endo-1,5-alpha-L-arabinosidase
VHEGEARSHVDLSIVLLAILLSIGCGGSAGGSSGGGGGGSGSSVLSSYKLVGNTTPVRDPSLFRQGNTYYVFSTDPGAVGIGSITIRCSTDRINWTACGYVFPQIPAWVVSEVPGVVGLWAPDISYFNGLYHVYYACSTFGSNTSVIGLATNTTLDPSDPSYNWVDRGMVLQSISTDNFNAIDPTILVDNDGNVWLTYGSYWTGIKQRQIDPASGMLLPSNTTVYSLASRPGVQYDPIEGSSLVHKGNYYYLFVSMDFCCMPDPYQDNYKIAVGRGMGPHGPFLDQNGMDMMNGGGTILLQGNGTTWNAPGGETVYLDAQQGDMITFHALSLPTGAAYLFVNPLSWPNGWPQIEP